MELPVIQFDRELFFSGQPVTGRVTLSTASDQPALGYKVNFLGRTATVSLNYRDFDCPERQAKETKVQQIHVEGSEDLWVAEKGKNIIPSGTYIWNFSFLLPIDCPSSFEGRYGFVRYRIQVLADKPNGQSFVVESLISVASLTNLNLIPKSPEVPKWKFEEDKVVLTVTPPESAVSGETILITGLIENNHKETKVKAMKVGFYQSVGFSQDARSPHRELQIYMKKKKELQMQRQEFQVLGGYSREFSIPFEIPPIVGTIRNSKYLSVEYTLQFYIKDSFGWKSDKKKIRILIGNVPMVAEGSSAPEYTLMNSPPMKDKDDRYQFAPVFPYYGGHGI